MTKDKKKDEKRPVRRESGGSHQPFAAEMGRIKEQERQAKEAKRAAEQAARDEVARKEKEAAEEAKFAKVRAIAKEARERHPSLPEGVYDKIRTSESKGEAKRVLREYLIASGQAASTETQPASQE